MRPMDDMDLVATMENNPILHCALNTFETAMHARNTRWTAWGIAVILLIHVIHHW